MQSVAGRAHVDSLAPGHAGGGKTRAAVKGAATSRPRRRAVVTDEMRASIRELREAGMTVEEVAAIFGVSRKTVSRCVKIQHHRPPQPKLPPRSGPPMDPVARLALQIRHHHMIQLVTAGEFLDRPEEALCAVVWPDRKLLELSLDLAREQLAATAAA